MRLQLKGRGIQGAARRHNEKGPARDEPGPLMCFLNYGKQQDGKPSINGERECVPWSSTGLLHRAWISVAWKFCSGFRGRSITCARIRDFTLKGSHQC